MKQGLLYEALTCRGKHVNILHVKNFLNFKNLIFYLYFQIICHQNTDTIFQGNVYIKFSLLDKILGGQDFLNVFFFLRGSGNYKIFKYLIFRIIRNLLYPGTLLVYRRCSFQRDNRNMVQVICCYT